MIDAAYCTIYIQLHSCKQYVLHEMCVDGLNTQAILLFLGVGWLTFDLAEFLTIEYA